MRIRPRGNTGRALPSEYFALGYTEQSVFNVELGKDYTVFGMAVWESMLLFLIEDESQLPNWEPAELFSITDAKLTGDWYFSASVAKEHGVRGLWGYERLVKDEAHYEALLERDPDALRSFREERQMRERQD